VTDDVDALRARMRISCADATTLLTDYDEGALALEDRVRVAAHLAWCEACAAFLDQLRTTTTALGAWGAARRAAALPPPVSALREAFRATRGARAAETGQPDAPSGS
jgi:predicted anti-sigma-YlaC factor YlaD